MGISWINNGIWRFGDPLPSWMAGHGSGPLCYGYGGEHIGGGAGVFTDRLHYPDGHGDAITEGPWMVLTPSTTDPLLGGARVVSTPVYSAIQDTCSMELWAMPSYEVAVQSIPVTLDPVARDPSTGTWPALKVDSIASQISAGSPTGVSKLEAFWLDKTRVALVGSAATVWSTTPSTSWTPQTSWTSLTPPTSACYVALRFTWAVDALAGGIMTAHFREPAVVFDGAKLMNIGSFGFAARYH